MATLKTGLTLTPWHPVQNSIGFAFPNSIATRVGPCAIDYVYNLVLTKRDALLFVDNTFVVTLGHGITAPIASHAFWGTSAVIDVLKKDPSYKNGVACLDSRAGEQKTTVTLASRRMIAAV